MTETLFFVIIYREERVLEFWGKLSIGRAAVPGFVGLS